MAARAWAVARLRPARPLKARVTRVSSGAARARASAQASGVPASGARRKAAPIRAALAPRARAAATGEVVDCAPMWATLDAAMAGSAERNGSENHSDKSFRNC